MDSSSLGNMNLSSHVSIHRFVNFPRRVWIEHTGKSVVCDEKITWFCCFYPGELVEREGKELHTLLLLQNREGKASAVDVVLFYEIAEKLLIKVDNAP